MAKGITVDFNANVAKFTQSVDKINGDLSRFEQKAKNISSGVNKALAGIGVGVSVAGFASLIRANIDLADHLNDLSKSTGVAVKDLAGLQLAAKQSGTDLDSVAQVINKLSVNIGKDSEKFRALGITAKEPVQALAQLADVYRSIEDPQTRAAVAAAALGKSWQDTAPLLAEGGDAILEMVAKGQRLSGITQEMASAADKFNDDAEELKATLSGLGVAITGPVINGFVQLIDQIKFANREGTTFISTLQGIINFATQSATTERGLIEQQIALQQKKIAVMQNQGAFGKAIDDFAGQDINLEKNKLDALQKKLDDFDAKQKQVVKEAQAGVKLTKEQLDTFVAGGEKEGGSKKPSVIFDNVQLAKSEAIIARLRENLGLSREQAAGVVGNLFQESGLNSKITNSIGAFGLAQWLGDRKQELKQFASSRGQLATDFNTQIDFIVREFQTTEKNALARLKNTSGLEDATTVVRKKFERPGEAEANDERRVAAAKTAFLGGLTESEVKNQLAAQEDAFKKAQEGAEQYKQTLAGLTAEIANNNLPEFQRRIAEEESNIFRQLGLDAEQLTETQKNQKAAIHELVVVKNLDIEASKRQGDELEASKKALAEYLSVMGQINDIADGLVGREELNKGLTLAAEAYASGIIQTEEEFKRVTDRLGEEFNKSVDAVAKGTDDMSEYARQAARNMQDTFADFLFDPFKDGVEGMANNFADALRRMAANYLAQEIFDGAKGLFSSSGGASGIGDLFSSLFSSVAAFDVGTPRVPKTGLAVIHKDEAVIPARFNRAGMSPYGHNEVGMAPVINMNMNFSGNADPAQVRRAAGQGAREALAAVSASNRYR